MPNRVYSRLPLLMLAFALAVAFYRLLMGEVFFWGLPSLQFYPWREYAFDLLRNGQLPFWNPYNGAGAPLLANYQSGLLYPLNWLGLVLPLAWSMSITAVLHLFIAGFGMWMFTSRLGLTDLGRGISALSFGMTSYLIARLGTYPIIFAAAWIPLVMWAVLGILMQTRRRDAAWLAAFAAMQLLAGHAQTTWYSMLLIAVFSVWWALTHRPLQWRSLALVMIAVLLGAGIAAAQLLPTGELLLQSQRSGGVDYDFAMNYSYAPARFLNLFSPNFFGNPGDGTYVTKGAFFEDAVYVGLIPLISALVAVLTWVWGKLRRADRPAYFATVPLWLIVVVIAFLFALGKYTPIFPFLYRNIPTFSLFQAPVRWHIWTVFGLSVLAGIGVGMWKHGHWLFFGTRLATTASIGAAVLALLAPRFLPPNVTSNDGVQVIIQAVVVMGILGALAGALTLTHPEDPANRWYGLWKTAVWLVIAADLVYAAQGLNPTVSASFFNQNESDNSLSERAYWPKNVEEDLKFEKYLQFEDYRTAAENLDALRTSNLPNLNLLDRSSVLNNFEPLLVGDFARYLKLIEDNPVQQDNLLRAAGVSGVYDDAGLLQPLEQPGTRAWFAHSVCQSGELLATGMLSPDWKPLEQVYLVSSGAAGCSDVTDSPGEVLGLEDHSTSVIVNVRTDQPGTLVLADAYYPGWKATVDGNSVEIMHADLAFRAVSVPAGTQTVRFDYQPWWILPGALVSVICLLVLLVLFRSCNPENV